MWYSEKSGRAYPQRDDFVRACVPILRRELELVREAGADIAQIDDPIWPFVESGRAPTVFGPDAAASAGI
jgi:methionine synthase II (cobalamin-independent)